MFISNGRRHISAAGPLKGPEMKRVVVNLPLEEDNVQPYEYLHTNYRAKVDTSFVYAIRSTRMWYYKRRTFFWGMYQCQVKLRAKDFSNRSTAVWCDVPSWTPLVNQTAYLWNEEIPQVFHKQYENHLPLASVNCGLDTDVISQIWSLCIAALFYCPHKSWCSQNKIVFSKIELFCSMVCP